MFADGKKRMQWLFFDQGSSSRMDDFPCVSPVGEAQDCRVLIGQWYYYLHATNETIDLCRTREDVGRPWLTEVLNAEEYAISEDDLESAVRQWTNGTMEPGYYQISPQIEQKLRILLE